MKVDHLEKRYPAISRLVQGPPWITLHVTYPWISLYKWQVGIEKLFWDITKTAFHIPSERHWQAPFSPAASAGAADASCTGAVFYWTHLFWWRASAGLVWTKHRCCWDAPSKPQCRHGSSPAFWKNRCKIRLLVKSIATATLLTMQHHLRSSCWRQMLWQL